MAAEPSPGAAAITRLYDGREVAAGEARVVDPIARCVVTTRDPEAGRT